MYSVEADKSKRLVVISAAGRVTKEEAKQAAQQVRDILKDFAPGFRVLADFHWLTRRGGVHRLQTVMKLRENIEADILARIRHHSNHRRHLLFSQILKFKSRPLRPWLMRCKA
jgi:hypothetical protein